jgi:hypothetical protein
MRERCICEDIRARLCAVDQFANGHADIGALLDQRFRCSQQYGSVTNICRFVLIFRVSAIKSCYHCWWRRVPYSYNGKNRKFFVFCFVCFVLVVRVNWAQICRIV